MRNQMAGYLIYFLVCDKEDGSRVRQKILEFKKDMNLKSIKMSFALFAFVVFFSGCSFQTFFSQNSESDFESADEGAESKEPETYKEPQAILDERLASLAFKTYENKAYGYQTEVPESWKLQAAQEKDLEKTEGILDLLAMDENDFIIDSGANYQGIISIALVKQKPEEVLEILEERDSTFRRTLSIGSEQAVQLEGYVEEDPWYGAGAYLMTIFEHKGKTYEINLFKIQYRTVYDYILKHFTFLE